MVRREGREGQGCRYEGGGGGEEKGDLQHRGVGATALNEEGRRRVGETAQEVEVLEVLARLEGAVVKELHGIRAARLSQLPRHIRRVCLVYAHNTTPTHPSIHTPQVETDINTLPVDVCLTPGAKTSNEQISSVTRACTRSLS